MLPGTFIFIHEHIPSVYKHENFMFHVKPYSYGKINVNEDFYSNDFNDLLRKISDYILKKRKG